MFERTRVLVSTHWTAIGVSLVVALLVASPLIAFPYVAGGAYRGLNIAHIADEHFYLSRGKEVLEGNDLGQPFLAEGKDAQDVTFSYADKILVAPVRILGLSDHIDIVTYYNIANSIGVFLVALLMYAFAFALSKNRWMAIAGPVFAIGAYGIHEAHTFTYSNFDIYGRSPFPFMSSIPFFAFLYVLHEAVVAKRGRAFLAAAGIVLGVLCYVYLFAWTFAFALLGALALIYLFMRDWSRCVDTCAIGLLGLLLGSPQIIHLFTFLDSPVAAQLSYFYFSVRDHAPAMSHLGLVTAGMLATLLWFRGRDDKTPLIAAIIAAGWIVLNQQIVTGRVLQDGHYYWYFISPLAVILGSQMLWRLLPTRFARFLPPLMLLVALFNVAGQQYRAFRADLPSKIQEQAQAPILNALQTLPKGVVLAGAGGETDPLLVTIYTLHDLYWIPAAASHEFPIERLQEALELHLYLNQESRSDPALYLRSALAHDPLPATEYVWLYGELEGFYSGYDHRAYQRRVHEGDSSLGGLRDRLLERIDTDYKLHFSEPQVASLLEQRGVRYIVWNSDLYPEWDLSPLGPMSLVVTSGNIRLYALEK